MNNPSSQFLSMKANLNHLWIFSLLEAICFWMTYISWRKWPDILIDFGRELYVPWQLSQGAALYSDIAYFNGPLSPYINSLLFKIFSPSLTTIIIFNLFLVQVTALLIFGIFKKITDNLNAMMVVCAFLTLFAFSQYLIIGNFNFITPYSHELTHGIIISFFIIFSFSKYIERKNFLWLISMGISSGLVFLTKPEIFLAISTSFLINFFIFVFIQRLYFKEIIKNILILGAGFSFPILLFGAFLVQYSTIDKAIFNILSPYLYLLKSSLYSSPYYLWVTGMDRPFLNLKKLISSLAWISAGFFLFLVIPLYLLNKIINKKIKIFFITLIIITMFFSIPYLRNFVPWMQLLRPLPLIIIGVILYVFMKLLFHFRTGKCLLNFILLHTFAWFSFILLLKIILNVHVYHYGFALAMPATLLSIFIILSPLSNKIGEKFRNKEAARLLSVALIIVFILLHIDFSSSLYNLKSYSIGSGENRIITWNPEISAKGVILNKTFKKIEELIKPEETFLVLPEGIMLNFLTKRKNPTPYINFMPPELIIFDEEQIINSFKNSSPDFIILIDKNLSVFGYKYFGKDYGEKIYQWVIENYTPIVTIGNEPFSGEGFGIKLFKKN